MKAIVYKDKNTGELKFIDAEQEDVNPYAKSLHWEKVAITDVLLFDDRGMEINAST